MARAGAARRGAVRRRARRLDRQRRAAVDRHATCNFSQDNLSWVVNAYTLTFGGFLLLGGRMADLLGRRRMFIVGLILFAVASLAGGLAQSDGLADRRPRRPGPRRRAALPGRALARHHDLRRGRRAQQGAGRLGRGRRLRRRRRRAARRHAHRVGRLGVGPVRQRADRPRRRAARARACCPRAATRARATSTSPAPSRSPPACRCSSTRSSTPTTPAGARPRRSACRASRSLLIAAFVVIERRTKRAAGPVPGHLPHPHDHAASTSSALLVAMSLFSMFFFISLYMQQVLGYDALKAGPRLPAAGGRDHRLGRRRLGARDALRLQAGADRRPAADRGRAGLVLPGLGRRHATSATSCSRRCSPRSASASRSCR